MTTLSASGIAALRIREARQRKGWKVKDLAARCDKAGFPRLTAAVITNLETRRKPGREISAEELLALALVLEVPPVQLLSPLGGNEMLRVVPGEEKGPMEATAWLADDDAMMRPVHAAASIRPEDTEAALRYRQSPLTLLRQIRAAIRQVRRHDSFLTDETRMKVRAGTPGSHRNAVEVLGVRLLHLIAALEAAGYAAPPAEDVTEILTRYGIPATLAELDEVSGDAEEGEGEA